MKKLKQKCSTSKETKINYDAEYKIGNTKVYIVSPENEVRLNRKMTEEEKQKILDEVSIHVTRIYKSVNKIK